MLEKLIASSISQLKEEMVMDYAKKEGYSLKSEEALKITYFLKQNWQALYHQDRSCLKKIQNEVSKETYKALLQVYDKAIQTYLNT